MNASERINAILGYYRINAKTFSERVGMERPQAIYDIINGKTRSITEKMAIKIISVFSDINKSWLISGEGEMIKGQVRTFELKTDKEAPLQKVPLFEHEATAGFSALYRDLSSAASDYISIPNLPPVDGAIYARGDSMSPLIASGDIVVFKKVELHPDSIIWGSIYIISYTLDGDDYTVLKYIRHSDRTGYIRLESFNTRFDPQDIPSSSITALAIVKASITFHTIG